MRKWDEDKFITLIVSVVVLAVVFTFMVLVEAEKRGLVKIAVK